MAKGSIVGSIPCPGCRDRGRDRTGDHLIVFDAGNGYCARCDDNYTPEQVIDARQTQTGASNMGTRNTNKTLPLSWMDDNTIPALDAPDRLLSSSELQEWGVRMSLNTSTREPEKMYFPTHVKGKLTGYKVKNLVTGGWEQNIGSTKKADLGGQVLSPSPRRMVLVCEGEIDGISAMKMLRAAGKDYTVTYLPSGVKGTLSLYSQEYLSKYEKIITCFDNDEAGQDGAKSFATMFNSAQVYNMRLPAPDQDVNEYLTQTGEGYTSKRFLSMVWNASATGSSDILSGAEIGEKVNTYLKEEGGVRVPYPWPTLQERTKGQQYSRMCLWIGGSSCGKSSVVRELYHRNAKDHGVKSSLFSLEDTIQETALILTGLNYGVVLNDLDKQKELGREKVIEMVTKTMEELSYMLLDYNGDLDIDSILTKIRYVHHQGVRNIQIDNLSLIDEDGKSESGFEKIVKPLAKIVNELGIRVDLVAHLRKTREGTRSYEQGAVPNMDSIAGFAVTKQIMDDIIAVSRDVENDDIGVRDIKQLHVLKLRGRGDTGSCDYLRYSMETGQHEVVTDYSPTPTDVEGNTPLTMNGAPLTTGGESVWW